MKTKLSFLVVTAIAAASLTAESIAPPVQLPAPTDENLVEAMYDSSIHNPASLMVIAVLCVFAWLCDTLPFVDSKFVPHYTVILGASIYWLFALPSSVAANFPHPAAVFICNGIICGFIASVAHRQIVARAIAYVQSFGVQTQSSDALARRDAETTNLGK